MTTTCQPSFRGWGPDPGGRHELRWYAHGRPTSLVQDGDVSRYDPLAEYETASDRPAPPPHVAPHDDLPAPQIVVMPASDSQPIEGSEPLEESEPVGLAPDPLATWFSSEDGSYDFWTRRRGPRAEDGRWRYRVAVRRRR